ncbi:non-ribosomal peptide synthetase [Saccharothrix xinjiangensis]|uniref:Non-ribosomal peptide synthetase n=1 Tax=Saccharothrix xinjiangensis TaxID=204798 RepID=A0ABV9Y4A9_9PSEU
MTPGPRAVHEVFAEQAARTPEAVAVLHDGVGLTYRELDGRSAAAAAGLRSLGVGPESVVGLCVDRSPELVVGVLAVLRAGGAYLALDPAYPDARLSFMLADSGARLVVTGARPGVDLPDPVRGLTLDDLAAAGRGGGTAPDAADPDSADPDAPAYVLYTSGSTGRPKGVLMGHRPLAHLVGWHRDQDGDLVGHRTLQFAPISFDVSFQEIFSTLCSGGTLVLLDERRRRDPGLLARTLVEQRVNRLFLPAAVLHPLAVAGRDVPPPGALREVVCAGEQLRITPAVREWFGALPGCVLHNHYGPTETHVVTAHRMTGDPADWPALPPIGRALPHVRAHVLDEAGNPVDVGEGELHLGGDCLAHGYLGRDDLTAERFPTGPADRGRTYRTGDLVRRDPGGVLTYLARADHQVKIRGYRVEPGEVEAVLAEHPEVRDCVVVARENPDGWKQLVAYVVPVEAPPEGAGEVVARRFEPRWFDHLSARLPDFSVPATYVTLAGLPMTPSGKVDRLALPDPVARRPRLAAPAVPPRPGLQAAVAGLWREVLQLSEVGAHDNFFDLGGSSLLLAQVVTRLADLDGVDRPVPGIALLLEDPTVAGWAGALAGEGRAPGGGDRSEAVLRGRRRQRVPRRGR